MTIEELEGLKSDLKKVRAAVNRHSPLFREIAANDFLAKISLPYAFLVILFGLGTHILLKGTLNYSLLPPWWLPSLWVFLVLLLIVGSVVKMRFLGKGAAARGARVWAVVISVWGNEWFHVNAATALVFLGVSLFAAGAGHAWYILSAASVWFGIYLNAGGAIARRKEYYVSGWFGVVSGLVSLAYVEASPWLWLAITEGGMLLLFGIGGLLPAPKAEAEAKE